jgi:hypothetical protein
MSDTFNIGVSPFAFMAGRITPKFEVWSATGGSASSREKAGSVRANRSPEGTANSALCGW